MFENTGLSRYLNFSILKLSLVSAGASGISANNESQSLSRATACTPDPLYATRASSPPLANAISEASSEIHTIEFEKRRKLRDAQKSLHILLETDISKLCDILGLPVCLSFPTNLRMLLQIQLLFMLLWFFLKFLSWFIRTCFFVV